MRSSDFSARTEDLWNTSNSEWVGSRWGKTVSEDKWNTELLSFPLFPLLHVFSCQSGFGL